MNNIISKHNGKLYNFAKHCQNVLDSCENKDFADLFIYFKTELYHKYQKGLILSTSHGIDIFNNIIKYYDNAHQYKIDFKIDSKSQYELNFMLLLMNN
jgi:hypothetical protein